MDPPATGYDVFVSYAHEDDQRFVNHLIGELRYQFALITGRELQIFFDQDGIPTAQRWERQIQAAMTRCGVLLAVLSPAYLRSIWCGREFDFFMAAEVEQALRVGHENAVPRIFPVLPTGNSSLNSTKRGYL